MEYSNYFKILNLRGGFFFTWSTQSKGKKNLQYIDLHIICLFHLVIHLIDVIAEIRPAFPDI